MEQAISQKCQSYIFCIMEKKNISYQVHPKWGVNFLKSSPSIQWPLAGSSPDDGHSYITYLWRNDCPQSMMDMNSVTRWQDYV